MPSYIIHLAIAEEYAKKYGVEEREQFIAGTIYPDTVQPKTITHYSKMGSEDTNLYEFLCDKKLESSFEFGHFLHLVADCIFYQKYFPDSEKMDIKLLYNDYDILTDKIINKYNLQYIPEEIEKYVVSKNGKTVQYHFDKIVKFIDEVLEYELHSLAKEILEKQDYTFLLK